MRDPLERPNGEEQAEARRPHAEQTFDDLLHHPSDRVPTPDRPISLDDITKALKVERRWILRGRLGASHRMLLCLYAHVLDIDRVVVDRDNSGGEQDGNATIAKAE